MADGSARNDKAFGIGSHLWPGLSKLIEEAGEVQQVAGKIIGCGGAPVHFDGTDMRERLQEELADLGAAFWLVIMLNDLDVGAIQSRQAAKTRLFQKWHAEARANG